MGFYTIGSRQCRHCGIPDMTLLTTVLAIFLVYKSLSQSLTMCQIPLQTHKLFRYFYMAVLQKRLLVECFNLEKCFI